MANSITPPPELVQQWAAASPLQIDDETYGYELFIAHHAAQWGADQELKACCDWFQDFYKLETWMERDLKTFRVDRRPKPVTLKQQALDALNEIEDKMQGPTIQEKLIRRALEALPDGTAEQSQ